MSPERRRPLPRTPGERVFDLLRAVFPVALALILAVLLFNTLIMPRFVRHGREVEVPDVVSLSLAEAREKLDAAGLAVRDTVKRASLHVSAGMVLDQSPRAGVQVKPHRGIGLVVSQGQVEQRIPRISGQTLRAASLALNRDGYELGDVLRIASASVKRNFVMASDPPEGERAMPGERIHLLVSDGPEKPVWIMPDLSGRELQLTADRLNFAGFVAVIERDGRWFEAQQRVRATDPAPGAIVAEGDTIRLYGR